MTFEDLIEGHSKQIFQIARRFARDYDEAEDIYQEIVFRAWRYWVDFRNNSSFYTWIYKIGMNTAINYVKSKNKRPNTDTPDFFDDESSQLPDSLLDSDSPEAILEEVESEEIIQEAVEELPEEIRDAEILCDFANLSYEGVAEVLDCPIGTVRSRIARARRHIYNSLENV